MHLVCELQTDFSNPSIHAPELTYWLKDAILGHEEDSTNYDYSSGYHYFLASRLKLALPLPLAALTRAWQGKATQNKAWGLLQLINLQAGRDEVGLQPARDLQVAQAEHEAIEQSIQPLLLEDGFTLEPVSPGAWHISGDELAQLHCADLARAAGHELRSYMPRAVRANDERISRKWWRIMNELQMLLYSHPVNDARAAHQAPALNALWLSGCGNLPTPAPAKPAWTYASVEDIAQLDALIKTHGPSTLTLCSAERYLKLEKVSFFKRLLQKRLTTQSVLSRL